MPLAEVSEPDPDKVKVTGRSAVIVTELPSFTTGLVGVTVRLCAKAKAGMKEEE